MVHEKEKGKRPGNDLAAGLNQGARPYWEYMAAPRARRKRILELARQEAFHSAVDLGCGNGALLKEVQKHFPGVQLAGVDQDQEQIQNNRQRLGHISWIAAQAQSGALVDGLGFSPDLVLCTELLEHVNQPVKLLENIHQVLAPEGRLLLSTQSGKVFESEKIMGHAAHFSIDQIKALLNRAGFNRVRAWNEGFPFHGWSKQAANRFLPLTAQLFGKPRYGTIQRAMSLALEALFQLNSRHRGSQLYAVAWKQDKQP